jgi:hypothetical protein
VAFAIRGGDSGQYSGFLVRYETGEYLFQIRESEVAFSLIVRDKTADEPAVIDRDKDCPADVTRKESQRLAFLVSTTRQLINPDLVLDEKGRVRPFSQLGSLDSALSNTSMFRWDCRPLFAFFDKELDQRYPDVFRRYPEPMSPVRWVSAYTDSRTVFYHFSKTTSRGGACTQPFSSRFDPLARFHWSYDCRLPCEEDGFQYERAKRLCREWLEERMKKEEGKKEDETGKKSETAPATAAWSAKAEQAPPAQQTSTVNKPGVVDGGETMNRKDYSRGDFQPPRRNVFVQWTPYALAFLALCAILLAGLVGLRRRRRARKYGIKSTLYN